MMETLEMRKTRILTEMSPMAKRIAYGFKRRLPPRIEVDDLVAAAMFGLWDAIRLHPEAPPGFEYYASMRIRGAVLDELRVQDWLPRRHRAAVEEGRAQSVQIVYDQREIDLRAGDGDPELEVARKEVAEGLALLLRGLDPRDRKVLTAFYFREEKMKAMGEKMGVSEPRVSQIHWRALERLRKVIPESWRP